MKVKKQKINFDLLIFLPFLIIGLVLIILLDNKINAFIAYKNSQIKPKITNTQLKNNSTNQKYLSVENFKIKIDNNAINPDEIRVKKDSKIILDIKVFEGYHNLVIEGYGVRSKRIPTNKSGKLTFIASQSGTFKVYSKTGMNTNEPKESVLIVD